MTSLTSALLDDLLAPHRTPCLSLYQPTHRAYPANREDPIRFRNLVKELETSLRQKYPTAEAHLLLQPFAALTRDRDFWNHTLDGLAVLGGPGFFRTLRFPQPVMELAVVADSFHTKPLRRFLQTVDRFQVLGLSLHALRLFEGNRRALDEVDLAPGVPRTITEALGGELTEPHQTVASYGGVGGSSVPMRHGHGGKSDEADIDADRFFRAVDRAVLEHYSRPSGLPLILAALPEHHHRFHQVSQNPFLVSQGIRFNLDSLSADELRVQAWEVIEPKYPARLAALKGEFEHARSRGIGSDDLAQVAEAAVSGRVATLMIEAGRQIAGRLDGATGRIESADLSDPQVDDLLDDLGELVVSKGGTVLVIPTERMALQTGLAATYRY
ncbi:MAG: hypothetical protein GEV13_18970 [Rhodospirillales bacterium]|nr:hypothetical protein [Rhodospirillales bacterium]